jgi:hypothetical protein
MRRCPSFVAARRKVRDGMTQRAIARPLFSREPDRENLRAKRNMRTGVEAIPRYSTFDSRIFAAGAGTAASKAAANDHVKTEAMRTARERPTDVTVRLQAIAATEPATKAPRKRLRT